MRSLVALFGVLALAIGLGAYGASRTRPAPPPESQPKIKLAVLVVFDQMRGDYPARWMHLYGAGGFRRLADEAAWFTDCHYPYGVTTTGPGHASMLTGTCPDKHGIVNNNWRQNGKDVYCAASPAYRLAPPVPGVAKQPDGGTPDWLLSETVADVLKRARPRSKVFGLSLKDRSAILPTGKAPDGAFWFDGRLVTSTYYTEKLGRRVPAWAATGDADTWFGRPWTRFRPDLDYEIDSGPDDEKGEGAGTKQGRTFPHPTTGGLGRPGKEYYNALAYSPFGNDFVLNLAKKCIAAENIGQDDVPDLLVVSFSSNDLIGHTWGPDSQEVLDVTLRTDALLADLMKHLDAKVGKGSYLLGLTADHGICPMPEVSRMKGREAQRVNLYPIRERAEAFLKERFGDKPAKAKSTWIEAVSFPWVYVNQKWVAQSGFTREEVAVSLSKFLNGQPELARAFSRFDPPRDELQRRMMRSFHPARSGDVCVVLRPWDLPMEKKPGDVTPATGTTHGSPYFYDSHVPLIVMGPGIPGGSRQEHVTPQALAAIFSRALGVPSPKDAEFPVPATLDRP
jgi:predicted AlkP superfamily pyrophosphatase or phosphodiesterase